MSTQLKTVIEKEICPTFDEKDRERVEKFRWRLEPRTGYWRRSVDGMALHIFLMGKAPRGFEWDHKDGNKNNNKSDNLRIATSSQNKANLPAPNIQKTSKYKGVYLNKKLNKWIAQIKINSKARYLGCFIVEEDAAKAYDVAAKELFGEFANTNF